MKYFKIIMLLFVFGLSSCESITKIINDKLNESKKESSRSVKAKIEKILKDKNKEPQIEKKSEPVKKEREAQKQIQTDQIKEPTQLAEQNQLTKPDQLAEQNQNQSNQTQESNQTPASENQPENSAVVTAIPKSALNQEVKVVPFEETYFVSKPKVFDPSIPLKPLSHFGGLPTNVSLDDSFVYVSFGRQLVVYDLNLQTQTSIYLEAPIQDVVSTIKDGKRILYVKEVGHILEILSFEDSIKSLKILKSFQVDGDFQGAFVSKHPKDENKMYHQLLVYLDDRIQILDVSQPDEIQILFELPLKNVKQIFPYKNSFFVVENESLTIVNQNDLSVLSTIPLGNSFKILRVVNVASKNHLVLALKDKQLNQYNKLQYLPLSADDNGILNLGEVIPLNTAAQDIEASFDYPVAFILRQAGVSFYMLESKTEITESDSAYFKNDIRFVKANKKIVVVSDLNKILYFDAESLLNQIPVDNKFKAQTQFQLALMANVQSIHLPMSSTALVVNQSDSGPALFYSTNFQSENPIFQILETNKITKPNIILMSQLGFFLFNQPDGKVFQIPYDFSQINELRIAGQNVVGMATFKNEKNNLLYVATDKLNNKGVVGITAYALDSKFIPRKLSFLNLKEVGGFAIFNNGANAVASCGSQGVCLIDLQKYNPKMSVIETLKPSKENSNALGVMLAPNQKIAYVFYENKEGAYISFVLLSAEKLEEVGQISKVEMSLQQFNGATFTSGGQKLVLPLRQGLFVYDVSHLSDAKLDFQWKVGEVLHADVTNRGQTVCLAKGVEGADCAQLE